MGGIHYFIFIDDYFRRVWAYLMKTEDEILEIFPKLIKMIETQIGMNIKKLRLDNYGEY